MHSLRLFCTLVFALITASAVCGEEKAPAFPIQVIAPTTNQYFRHSEGSALRLPDGRILLAWSRFYATEGLKRRDDDSPATIVLASSSDAGQTWSEPAPLNVGSGKINVMQASFLQLGERTQLYYSIRQTHTNADKWLIESTDGGKSWTDPRQITPGGKRFTGPNDRMLQLASGRIILPCHTTVELNGKDEHAPAVTFSDDKSATWSTPVALTADAKEYQRKVALKLHEPAVIERKDGSVWMIVRSTCGRFFESTSNDGGKSWSTLTITPIETLTAPPQLRRLSDGRLLLIWNPFNAAARAQQANGGENALNGGGTMPVTIKRSLLAIASSSDDGKSWSKPLVIADGGAKFGYCYPAVLELKAEGELLVFASQTTDVITPSSLVMIRVPLKAIP